MRFKCCFALALLGIASAPAHAAAPGKPLSARENFEKHCVDCHGNDGKAQTRLGKKSGAKNLTDRAAMAKLSDEEIFKTIKFGRKNSKGEDKMDAFQNDLSDAEITALVTYVRTFSK